MGKIMKFVISNNPEDHRLPKQLFGVRGNFGGDTLWLIVLAFSTEEAKKYLNQAGYDLSNWAVLSNGGSIDPIYTTDLRYTYVFKNGNKVIRGQEFLAMNRIGIVAKSNNGSRWEMV